MKLLILGLFVSIYCFADVRVSVENIHGRKYGARFESQAEADKWIDRQIKNNSWGKAERWEKLSKVKDKKKCLKLEDATIEQEAKCRLPVEYSIKIEDISEQMDAIRAIKSRKQQLRKRLDDGEDLSLKELNELLRN